MKRTEKRVWAEQTQVDVNDLIDISFYLHWHKNHRKWREFFLSQPTGEWDREGREKSKLVHSSISHENCTIIFDGISFNPILGVKLCVSKRRKVPTRCFSFLLLLVATKRSVDIVFGDGELRMKRQSDKWKERRQLSILFSLPCIVESLCQQFTSFKIIEKREAREFSHFALSLCLSNVGALNLILICFAQVFPIQSGRSDWKWFKFSILFARNRARQLTTLCARTKAKPRQTNIYDYKVVVNIKIIQQSSWEEKKRMRRERAKKHISIMGPITLSIESDQSFS